jgi:phosphatidylserine decarboxylase
MMTARALAARIAGHEGLNFALTNRIPRKLATRVVGALARSENPLVVRPAMALWRLFADLDLSDAETRDFPSLRACFTRALRPGARPVDPDPRVATSPCDAIVGACGRIEGTTLLQVKGQAYRLGDLLGDAALEAVHRGGVYVTLRLTSGMYHRFHAPHDLVVERVDHVPGDAWNVNPPALRRVPRLYCRNERAIVRTRLVAGGHPLTLVPVAAILVAGIRLHCAGGLLGARHGGPTQRRPMAPHGKGEEMGWFEHGSTIVVLAPPGFGLSARVAEGRSIRMGQPLLTLPEGVTPPSPQHHELVRGLL